MLEPSLQLEKIQFPHATHRRVSFHDDYVTIVGNESNTNSTNTCKHVTLADFLLPKKLSPGKKMTNSSHIISQFKNIVEPYSPS